jgi:hypothetical protein
MSILPYQDTETNCDSSGLSVAIGTGVVKDFRGNPVRDLKEKKKEGPPWRENLPFCQVCRPDDFCRPAEQRRLFPRYFLFFATFFFATFFLAFFTVFFLATFFFAMVLFTSLHRYLIVNKNIEFHISVLLYRPSLQEFLRFLWVNPLR